MTTVRLRPVSGALPELGARVEAHLRELAAQVLAGGRRVRKGGDAEAIHDLRVASRRLGATLSLWAPAFEDGARRGARRALRRLRRRLGRVREREVLLTQVSAMAREEPGLAETLEPEIARLSRRVARGRARAARRTRPARLAQIGERIERCLATRATLRSGPAGPRALLLRAQEGVRTRRRAALETIAEARSADDDARLHRGRVALKRWRYALESLAAAADAPDQGLAALRSLQQVLGAVNDAVVLRDYLARRAARNRARGRPARAASLERARERGEARRRQERARLSEALLALGLAAAS